MLVYSIFMSVAFLLSATALCLLLWKIGVYRRILARLGLRAPKATPNRALLCWNNMIQKLDYTPDIVFFGDSITRESDFRSAFPTKKIVNLGYSGDTLQGMANRVSMIQALSPKKVFLLGGGGGLKERSLRRHITEYDDLLDLIRAAVPSATVYVQGLLPVSRAKERVMCPNATIRAFNEALRILAKQHGCVFVDLYPLYEKNGEMDPALTVDGIHLQEKAYTKWEKAIAPYIDA
jgi:lysophospholipase L1-like esterase